MVNPNMKTPNKKRKSLPNVEADAESPKKTKLNESIKTPGKNQNANTPKAAKTPKANLVNTVKKDSNQSLAKTPKPTPVKVEGQKNSPKGFNKKNRKLSESDDSSPKKLKKFAGTSGLKSDDNKSSKKRRKSQYTTIFEKVKAGDKKVITELKQKIEAIESRKEKTKTARRKLKLLLKFKRIALGEELATPSKAQKRRARKAKGKNEDQKQVKKEKKPIKNENQQTRGGVKVEEEDDSDESSDFEVENEIKPGKIIKTEEGSSAEEEESSDEEEEGDEEEESGEEEEEDEEESEGEGEEESEEESEDEAEDAPENKKGKKPQTKQVETPDLKQLKDNKIINKAQKRYVVFVGNLPYDATKQEINEHFKKAGEVRHIRIPNDKKTNKPRGFAYVEFNNETDYQKGLSLHHTFIKGRQINVLYTQGGKKKGQEKKNEVKAKNFKLQAMRKQGQLAGSVKASQKRSARRAKKNAVKTSVNGSNS